MCGKPDWCIYVGPEDSPTAAICARIESPKRCGEAGWLHVLRDDGPTWATVAAVDSTWPSARMSEPATASSTSPSWRPTFARPSGPRPSMRLAVALGVSVESLRRLGMGWSAKHRAWSFPMSNAAGNVLGVRLRLPGGKKLIVRGGKEGLVHSRGSSTPSGLLLIAEGPTRYGGAVGHGILCGRAARHARAASSCWWSWCGKLKPSGVVIVADGDAPGQRGAESLASVLLAYSPSVRIITPPAGVKDAREWKRRGATAADVQAAIDAAPVRKLRVSVREKGRWHHGR